MKHAVAFLLALALPQTAQACAQLSQHVWLCDRGASWEAATWDQFGDGATLLLDDLILNFTEEWPGYEISDNAATLEEQYATYAAWVAADGNVPLEVLAVDTLELPGATVLRHLQRDRYDEEPVTMSAVMLAEVGTARIMLWLDGPESTPPEEIESASRNLAGLLRDNCADPVSCADDYERPSG